MSEQTVTKAAVDLHDSRVLVTGGAGLIGSTITDHLINLGVPEVVVLDNFVRGNLGNLASSLASERVRVVEGDIRERSALAGAMKGVDLVFHEAAIRITQCAEEPRLAMEVLVDGTFNVLESAEHAGVSKVVMASSASIYGLAEEFPTGEEHHPYANRTLYGAAKLFGEGLLRSFNEMFGMDYLALRYFNVYGPRMDIHGVYTEVLVRWMERIAAGLPPLILGPSDQTMDFVYIDDVARANVLAAGSPATDQVINVASGVETSLLELAETLIRVMGADIEPELGPARSTNPVARRLADVNRARDLIGFEARVGLEEGLSKLVDWWRQERETGGEGGRVAATS